MEAMFLLCIQISWLAGIISKKLHAWATLDVHNDLVLSLPFKWN